MHEIILDRKTRDKDLKTRNIVVQTGVNPGRTMAFLLEEKAMYVLFYGLQAFWRTEAATPGDEEHLTVVQKWGKRIELPLFDSSVRIVREVDCTTVIPFGMQIKTA
jgi:hypothetical protein